MCARLGSACEAKHMRRIHYSPYLHVIRLSAEHGFLIEVPMKVEQSTETG